MGVACRSLAPELSVTTCLRLVGAVSQEDGVPLFSLSLPSPPPPECLLEDSVLLSLLLLLSQPSNCLMKNFSGRGVSPLR